MKYIKVKCNKHYCDLDFLIEINENFIKDYGDIIHEDYYCPICGSVIYTDKNIEIVELERTNKTKKYYTNGVDTIILDDDKNRLNLKIGDKKL